MILSLKETLGKYLFPELFMAREDILKNNRALADKLKESNIKQEQYRQRCFASELLVKNIKKSIDSHDVYYCNGKLVISNETLKGYEHLIV